VYLILFIYICDYTKYFPTCMYVCVSYVVDGRIQDSLPLQISIG
jgi:hypothetical protein